MSLRTLFQLTVQGDIRMLEDMTERLDRRSMLIRSGKFVGGAAAAATFAGPLAQRALAGTTLPTPAQIKSASGTLNVVATGTYQTPAEDPRGLHVNWGLVGTNEQSIQKTAQPGAFDVVIVPNDDVDPFYVLNRLAPIDTSLIANWDKINPSFRDSSIIRRNGKVITVPHHWGYTYTVYDPRKMSQPKSLADIMSPKLTKKIAMPDDPDVAFTTMALLKGYKRGDHLTPAQFKEVTSTLKQFMPQLLTIFQYGQEGTTMATGNVDMLFGVSAAAYQLVRGAGVPADKCFLGSFCWWMGYSVLNGAKNPAGAYDFINHALSLPVLNAVTKKSGALPTVDAGTSAVPPAFRYKNASTIIKQAPFLAGPPVNTKGGFVTYQQMIDTWQELKA
jgi:spermidine/putrescine-binding protein